MQPYQEAAEANRQRGEFGVNFIKNAATTAATSVVGGLAAKAGYSLLSRIGPLLSEYVPESFAIKGLNKIDPRLGKFIKGAMDEGLDFNEIKDFIGEKLKKSQPAKEGRNVIQQYSPELFQHLEQEIKKGKTPIEAGSEVLSDKRFAKIIQRITKDHKTPWNNILQTIFGAANTRTGNLQKFNEKIKQPGLREQEAERFQNYYGQGQEQQQQGQGQGLDPGVAQILQQGQAIMQKFRR